MVDSSSDRSLHPYSPPTADFTEGARECIRRLARAAREGASVDRLADVIRASATSCARDARDAGARAEQFVVALKREWSAAADSAGVPRLHAMEIATRLVTAAIVDFFRGE